jgi:hypothetical protein
VVHGSGSTVVIITGDVLARDGKNIGDLHSLILEVLTAWEGLLGRWGLLPQRAV